MFIEKRQRYFLVLSLVVIVAVVMLAPNLTTAVIIVGLMTNFLFMSTQLMQLSNQHQRTLGEPGGGRPDPNVGISAGFRDEPEGFGNYGAAAHSRMGAAPYQGAVTLKPFGPDAGDVGPYRAPMYTEAPESGGTPIPIQDRYNLDRIGGDSRQNPCEHPAVDVFDADERNVHLVREKNDAHRVVAGGMRRKDQLSRYLKEELDEEENSHWWGQWDV